MQNLWRTMSLKTTSAKALLGNKETNSCTTTTRRASTGGAFLKCMAECLGIKDVNFVRGKQALGLVDSTLE